MAAIMETVEPLSNPASIRDVMNALCRSSGQIEDRRKTPRPDAATRALPDGAEIERFMAVDPLTVTLYKRYVDARTHYLATLGGEEKGSAMTDIAADLADSAWCALESRIHELRESESARKRAHLLETLEAQDRARRIIGLTASADVSGRLMIDRDQREKRAARQARDRAFFLIWLLWVFQGQTEFCHKGAEGSETAQKILF